MFEKIVSSWHEARGQALREEVEDSLQRLLAANQDVNALCATTFANCFLELDQRYRSISNISNKAKRALSKELKKKAKGLFDYNLGQAYGLFFLSAFLESDALPGEDAIFVRKITEDLLAGALSCEGFSPNHVPQSQEQDSVARSAINASKMLGANSAREAAEMMAGRALTDGEWAKLGAAWERNWDAD